MRSSKTNSRPGASEIFLSDPEEFLGLRTRYPNNLYNDSVIKCFDDTFWFEFNKKNNKTSIVPNHIQTVSFYSNIKECTSSVKKQTNKQTNMLRIFTKPTEMIDFELKPHHMYKICVSSLKEGGTVGLDLRKNHRLLPFIASKNK